MGLLRWRYRLGIQAPVNAAGGAITTEIEASPVDSYFKSMALGTVEAAGPTVFDFASDIARKHERPEVRAFASALSYSPTESRRT